MPDSLVDANSETCSPAASRQRSTWGNASPSLVLVRDDLHRSFRSSAWACASPFNRFAGENKAVKDDAPDRYKSNNTSAKVSHSRFKSSLREDDAAAAPARSRSATRSRGSASGITKASSGNARPKSASKKRPEWQSQVFHGDIARVHVSQRTKVLNITRDVSSYGAV